MSPQKEKELLIRIDERVETIFKILDRLPCKDHEKKNSEISTLITKHEERLNTHSKFLWGYFTSTLTIISGLMLLAWKTIFKS